MFYKYSERDAKKTMQSLGFIKTADNLGLLTAEVSKCMFVVKPQIEYCIQQC